MDPNWQYGYGMFYLLSSLALFVPGKHLFLWLVHSIQRFNLADTLFMIMNFYALRKFAFWSYDLILRTHSIEEHLALSSEAVAWRSSWQCFVKKRDKPSAGGSHMSGVWGRNNRGKPYPCILQRGCVGPMTFGSVGSLLTTAPGLDSVL